MEEEGEAMMVEDVLAWLELPAPPAGRLTDDVFIDWPGKPSSPILAGRPRGYGAGPDAVRGAAVEGELYASPVVSPSIVRPLPL